MPIPTNTYLEKVHISAIKAGDTIFHNERLMTVCGFVYIKVRNAT